MIPHLPAVLCIRDPQAGAPSTWTLFDYPGFMILHALFHDLPRLCSWFIASFSSDVLLCIHTLDEPFVCLEPTQCITL